MEILSQQENSPIIPELENIESTERFNSTIISKLNIKYVGTDTLLADVGRVSCDELYIQDLEPSLIAYFRSNDSLSIDEKTICQNICDVISTKKEIGITYSYSHNFINFILRKLELDLFPIKFELFFSHIFRLGEYWAFSLPEFRITKEDLMLLVYSDNYLNINKDNGFGEYKIVGDMLAVSLDNYLRIDVHPNIEKNKGQIFYSIRVIGTRFTFYKATVSYSYLDSLKSGFSDEALTVYRYPDQDEGYLSGYDYIVPSERRIIVDMLCQLASLFINRKYEEDDDYEEDEEWDEYEEDLEDSD